MKSETKTCQNCHKEFVIDASDFKFYDKIKVPPPTWCPECRAKRRFVWRNERTLWRTKSDATGKEILSMFPPEQFKIYEHEYWWSDKWDAVAFGRAYDFSRPFFVQFQELMKEVPWFNLSFVNAVNSEYCNNVIDLKNCYLLFDSGFSEDSAYCIGSSHIKSSFDLSACTYCERSANNFYCHSSYETFFSDNCENCTNVWFSRDCQGCNSCFGCVGLRNKSYYIFNKPYSKEQFLEEMKKINSGSYENSLVMSKRLNEISLKIPVKFMHGHHNTNVSGEYIYNSKNVLDSYWVRRGEESRFIQSCSYGPIVDSYDCCIGGVGAARCYECQGAGLQSADIFFSVLMYFDCYRASYCVNCHNITDCFGCVGLRKKQYCIFNKQYTKEEYEKLVPKIIEQMTEMAYTDLQGRTYPYGEFFPPELSPFAYNETVAQDYVTLSEVQAIREGFKWDNEKKQNLNTTKQAKDLPDSIIETTDDILAEVIGCLHEGNCGDRCTDAFRMIRPEFEFYKKMNLPLPRLCPNCRHAERLKLRTPMKFWHRACQCSGQKSSNGVYSNTTNHSHGSTPCPNEFETSYAPERPEIVYCEQCYQAEVV